MVWKVEFSDDCGVIGEVGVGVLDVGLALRHPFMAFRRHPNQVNRGVGVIGVGGVEGGYSAF